MHKYLIDVNLPYYFSLWDAPEFIHQADLSDTATDAEIWEYARINNLTIITKDSDFAKRILLKNPPPRVIHVRLGNMKMKDFHATLLSVWDDVIKLNAAYKLVNIFRDRLEAIN